MKLHTLTLIPIEENYNNTHTHTHIQTHSHHSKMMQFSLSKSIYFFFGCQVNHHQAIFSQKLFNVFFGRDRNKLMCLLNENIVLNDIQLLKNVCAHFFIILIQLTLVFAEWNGWKLLNHAQRTVCMPI